MLRRIEHEGAYANLVLGPALASSGLSEADRRFATDLVYGSTRMRRSCDALIDRFVERPPDDETRSILRLGAYQLAYGGVAPHAAVSETVEMARRSRRGFVNAVLRRVAASPPSDVAWPSIASELSYPDWIVERLVAELGDDARPALERMNVPPSVTTRPDGYVQDESSQWVAAAVEATPGERIVDLCAAPGGKATALAATGAEVLATDMRPHRVGLVRDNAVRLGLAMPVLVADGRFPPVRPGSCDAVLLDAPCSGLGALRRRADARWRISAEQVDQLVGLQGELLAAAATLVRPGGRLVYSVCTLTAAESIDHATPNGFEVDPTALPVGVWRAYGQGWRVLPHDADTDGMVVVRYRRTVMTDADAPAVQSAKVLTCSDGVMHGAREDTGGAGLVRRLAEAGFDVVEHRVTEDGAGPVAAALREMTDGFAGLVVTTGGTGFAPRDQTPEGTRAVIERESPGLAEAMRLCNPLGRLSRGVAGIVGASIVLNTPGSPKGCIEQLEAVLDVVPHALRLLHDTDRSH